ncbi:MAG: anthranilate synthase component II, partial [Nanoarchaeota archaeon]|nr:anthranilate synthase component II [Nanoarchaeota archaeon]
MKVFFIDNFDLFAYSLVDEFEKRNCEVLIYRNDVDIKAIDNAIKKFRPNLIVISSGPGNVNGSGNSVEVIQNYCGQIPIFGVGLGHLCIIEAFEGKIGRSPVISHGKTAKIKHDG